VIVTWKKKVNMTFQRGQRLAELLRVNEPPEFENKKASIFAVCGTVGVDSS
jgi:hypothetical protein